MIKIFNMTRSNEELKISRL